jgi:transcriptional regulator with XRE-family HTH domain
MNVTNPWLMKRDSAPDLEILEEAALAMAQATIQNALTRSGLSRAEFARRLNRPRSFVSRMLSGDHNLTLRTMAHALLVCGYEVRFGSEPLKWHWPQVERTPVVIDREPTAHTDYVEPPTALAA